MKKIKTIIFFALIITLMFILAGNFLVLQEIPQQSDAIIILSGDQGYRTEYGVSLYLKGFAPKVIMSGGIIYHQTFMCDLMTKHALELGVPKTALITEPFSTSTIENAYFTKKILKKNNYNSSIIVSSNYHMRRVKYIFDKIYKNSSIQLTYCCVDDPIYNPDKWWANNKSIMITLKEYIKLIGYVVQY